MKWINYKLNRPVNVGSDDNPVWKDNLVDKIMYYSEQNLSVVLKEAYNGEYTIEDDGQPGGLNMQNKEGGQDHEQQ